MLDMTKTMTFGNSDTYRAKVKIFIAVGTKQRKFVFAATRRYDNTIRCIQEMHHTGILCNGRDGQLWVKSHFALLNAKNDAGSKYEDTNTAYLNQLSPPTCS